VDLSEADCSAPTVLAPPSGADLEGLAVPTEWGADTRPRLESLRGADVAGLACNDVDLTGCRFAGAHHLDALRMDGATGFAGPPRPRRWPPSRWRRWSSRGVLAEERQWRATRPRWHGWQPPSPLEPGKPDEPVSPARVAGLYRALRKAREDAKDEPGAADFYYGEMEMRRHDPDRPRAERWILHAYWALAGYGLRASRAFTALAVVVAAGAIVLWTVGLGPALAGQPPAEPLSFADMVLYTIATASPVGASPLGRTLTSTGEAIRIALRFTGPVLLGFALPMQSVVLGVLGAVILLAGVVLSFIWQLMEDFH